MISYSFGKKFMSGRVYWFSERVTWYSGLKLSIYRQSYQAMAGFLFRSSPFHTLEVDLNHKALEIFEGFTKNTRYEIRRSEKDDVFLQVVDNLDDFIEFYASFARSKGRSPLGRDELNCYGKHLVITAAVRDGLYLVMHSYIVDKQASVVRLLHSASDFRSTNTSEIKQLIGRANRRLHWLDMCLFKAEGFSIYDFGGYAVDSVTDELEKINDFKRGFGGKIKKQYEHVSVLLDLVLWMRHFIRRIKS